MLGDEGEEEEGGEGPHADLHGQQRLAARPCLLVRHLASLKIEYLLQMSSICSYNAIFLEFYVKMNKI